MWNFDDDRSIVATTEDYGSVMCCNSIDSISLNSYVDTTTNDLNELKNAVSELGDVVKALTNRLKNDNNSRGIYLTSSYKTLNYQYKFRF